MPGRKVAVALFDVFDRLNRDRTPLSLDALTQRVHALAAERDEWKILPDVLTADVDDLTVAVFRKLIAAIRDYVWSATNELGAADRASVRMFATVQNVVRTLADDIGVERMAHMKAIRMPEGMSPDVTRVGQLVRSGHVKNPHWVLPVSSELYGSKLVSYFYTSGEQTPQDFDDIRLHLIAHDSDEFVLYLKASVSETPGDVTGHLPIFLEGRPDPYTHVRTPIAFAPGQWWMYDGNSPHYWFAPPGTVAFFVGASSNEMYRKPVAFRWHHGDIVPGGSYPLFPSAEVAASGEESSVPSTAAGKDLERTSYVVGRRLRRRRDGYGISARDIQDMRERQRITSNIIGKVENNAVPNVRVGTIADIAGALDLTMVELFPNDPSELVAIGPLDEDVEIGYQPLSLPEHGRPFAIAPSIVRPRGAPDGIVLMHGEADVALLVLRGSIDVYVVPDPLLLALELATDDSRAAELFDANRELVLHASAIERLCGTRLLMCDRVEANHAYHFNAALPHAVVAAQSTLPPVVLAVTTRADAELPGRWVGRGA